MRVPQLIAIDGPAASGKSSVARALAGRLGFAYVNSGALYRAMTWHVLKHGIDVGNAAAVAVAADEAQMDCALCNDETRILVRAKDPSAHLRDENVNRAVSIVSSVPRAREIIGVQLRRCAQQHDVVMEGRDIGSVVFPDTPFKFYIDASPEVRAGRRRAQGERDEIAWRDRFDSARATAPLMVAADAELIDSSQLTVEQVVEKILRGLAAKGFERRVRE